MTKHFSEADLLETYYMQPGQSMPVMMHLANCTDCAARYEKLERKLRETASCHVDEKPATFWTRQRMAIMRKVGSAQAAAEAKAAAKSAVAPRPWRMAVAAVLAFILGSVVMYKTDAHRSPAPAASGTASLASTVNLGTAPVAGQKTLDELPAARDAWQSDELQDFHNVVQWESWVDADDSNATGGDSL